MIYYSLYTFFEVTWKRWIIAFVILFGVAIGSKYSEPVIFLPAGEPLLLWDYVFSSFSNYFVMVLILPLLFCYLIGDMVIKDYEEGYIALLISRISTRAGYFVSKVVVIFIASLLLIIGYLLILLMVGLLFRLPWTGHYYYDVLLTVEVTWRSLLGLLVIQLGLSISSYVALGMFIVTLSLIFNHPVLCYAGIIALFIQAREPIFNGPATAFPYTPIAQGILILHAPYYYLNSPNEELPLILKDFTVTYSLMFCLIMFAVFFVVGMLRIRKTSLALKG